ncbi:MAG: hypothetical protein IKO99_05710 [Bacteroidales bacterium]|nr:hypothetical protein [Bacteroidales bacterium]
MTEQIKRTAATLPADQMTKKRYEKPDFDVIEVEMNKILCASGTQTPDNTPSSILQNLGFGGNL